MKTNLEISRVLLDWGISYLESGCFAEAVFTLEETTGLNPGDPIAWAALSLAAALSGDKKKARRYYLELIARNPNGKYARQLQPFFKTFSKNNS